MLQLSTRAKDLYPIFNKASIHQSSIGENDTLACGQSSHKTTMNKRKCSLSLSPAETHCSARWQGDSRSLITYCKNYKTALAANHYSGGKKPPILILTSPIICPDRNGPNDLPVRLLTAQIDRHHNMVHQFLLSKLNFLRIIHLEKRAYTIIEIAKMLHVSFY